MTNPIRLIFFGDFGTANPEKVVLAPEIKSFIASSDITALNFEGCLHHGEIQSPTGRPIPQSDNSPKWCVDNGFNLISLANNHTMDFGPLGLQSTISSFDNKAVVIGAGKWTDAYSYKMIDVHGVRIGFLAATSADFSALKCSWSDRDKVGCAWLKSPSFTTALLNATTECNYVFIIAHAGVEYLDVPLPEWRELYRHFIDLGASGVNASHPHVPQGIESYKGAPIFYSLGNFYFDGTKNSNNKHKHWTESIMAQITIDTWKLEWSSVPIVHANGVLQVDYRKEIRARLDSLSTVLEDDTAYLRIIQKELPKFYSLVSGYLMDSFNAVEIAFCWKTLKNIVIKLLKGKKNLKSALHQFREESTVYTIIRVLKEKSQSYL